MNETSNYIINAKSMAFLPSFNEYGEPNTMVLEEAETYTVSKKTYDVIDQGARYYGTTIKTNSPRLCSCSLDSSRACGIDDVLCLHVCGYARSFSICAQ